MYYRGRLTLAVQTPVDLTGICDSLSKVLSEHFDRVWTDGNEVHAKARWQTYVYDRSGPISMLPFSSVSINLYLVDDELVVQYGLGLRAMVITSFGFAIAASIMGLLAEGIPIGIVIGIGLPSVMFVHGWVRWSSSVPAWIIQFITESLRASSLSRPELQI